MASITKNPRIAFNYMSTGVTLRKIAQYKPAIDYQKKGIELIDNDNTLVGQDRKATLKGKMYFELAHTYSLANDISNAKVNLEAAFKASPVLRQKLSQHIANGYF